MVNPVSGRGRGIQAAEVVSHVLERKGVGAEVAVLSGPGSAASAIREKAGNHSAVAAVGGDGTINEVVTAMQQAGGDWPLGLVPAGLGNCLVRALGLPLDYENSAEVLIRGHTRELGLVQAGNRIMVSFLGAGLDAYVVKAVAEKRRGPIRVGDYFKRVWSVRRSYNWPEIQVEVDGRQVQGPFYHVLLSQFPVYARYFNLSPYPGFRVYLFRRQGLSGLLRYFLRMGPVRNLFRACDLSMEVEKSIRLLTTEAAAYFQVDGDPGELLPVECHVRKGAFQALVL